VVRADLSADTIVLDGHVPWVTGARFADILVTGGTCDDGRQVLVALDTSLAGVEVVPPVNMLALNASHTASVHLDHVVLPIRYLLAGPVEQVMKQGGSGGTGSITTSALAIGHVSHALEGIKKEASNRAELDSIHDALDAERVALMDGLSQSARGQQVDNEPPPSAEQLRQSANSLVMRATQAYLAACKGAGFCSGHPAERLLREAVFFLVWSCPQPVIHAALREFACLSDETGF
jgi:alkylation response protein AidB-like acyl-CoA dehydrogenase